MGFTRISEKNGEKNGENWSEIEITSFGENAITSIFAKGWDSLRFSKKMVKKNGENWSENEFCILPLNIYNLTEICDSAQY